MDREIQPNVRRKKLMWQGLVILLVTGALTLVGWSSAGLLKPTLSRDRVRTAKAELGPIEATISAAGKVVPEFEQVLSAPVQTRVLKILKRPGDVLRAGEPILVLDVNETKLQLEKLAQQIELKRNQQAKAKLDLQTSLNSLQSQFDLKKLDHKAAHAATARNQELHRSGLLSQELLKQAELQEEKIGVELTQLDAAKRTAQETTATQLAGLELEMKSFDDERHELQRQLELATTKADRPGVLTWVVTEEGASLQKGAVLARIADLSTFRVEATISDIHARTLTSGMVARIKVNDDTLNGQIAEINPTIKDGIMTVGVALDEKSNRLLRSNLRVDVYFVTAAKSRTLRLKSGPSVSGEGAHDVFVIRGNQALRIPVKVGISSFEQVEILDGLSEGDEVILSEMNDYRGLREITLKP